MKFSRLQRRALAPALALSVLAEPASAHDTWFSSLSVSDRGDVLFALSTGNQFPLQDAAVPLTQLHSSGCRSETQPGAPMGWVADRPTALVLRPARTLPASGVLSCWAQLKPLDVEIDDGTVEVYLREINATPAVRERWAALRARGVRWQETYTKHARVELAGTTADGMPSAEGGADTLAVDGLGMDIRLEVARPLRAGQTLRAQVLRDGKPLAGQPMELRNELSPVGIWRSTDAQGRLQITVPLAAKWLLRGVDLRPSAAKPDAWDSRFVTLAFEVLPKR